jgi:hypothetical protein
MTQKKRGAQAEKMHSREAKEGGQWPEGYWESFGPVGTDFPSPEEVPATGPQRSERTLESLVAALPPKEAARALVEAQIQILVNEVLATSAIEGVHLDPKEVRRAILIRLGREQGLL